jgi:hypothetical protein
VTSNVQWIIDASPTRSTTYNPTRFNPGDRRSFIGGSDARVIMGDDDADLIRLWREKRGEIEPEDLSSNLIVQLGTVTEHLNRHWYERNTGQVITEVQRQVFHPVKRWMAATLDGMVQGTGAVFEAKFMLPWSLELAQSDVHFHILKLFELANRKIVLVQRAWHEENGGRTSRR